MPKRIRLGTVTNGTLDSTDATIEIDGDDLYITVENGDVRTDGTVAFEDATADPDENGEIQRNGADLKAFSGGAVRSLSNIGSGVWETVTGAIRPDTADTDVIPNGDSSLGTSSDPWPAVTADDLTIPAPSGVTTVGTISSAGELITSDTFDLDDDQSQTIVPDYGFNEAGLIWVVNDDAARAALASVSGDSVSIVEQADTDWAASDSDGNDCVFRDGSNNLVVKNRTGTDAQTYHIFMLHISP